MSSVTAERLETGLDDILSSCATLMARRGYHGTTMRDLAHITGRSLSGLYYYFPNKEALLYLINKRGFESLLASSVAVTESTREPDQLLRAVIHQHVVFFGEHLSEMRVMMFGTQELNEGASSKIRTLKERYLDVVHGAVRSYILARSEGQLDDSKVLRRTYLLFGMMNWIYGWYSRQQHGSVDELANDIYVTFTRGCTASSKRRAV